MRRFSRMFHTAVLSILPSAKSRTLYIKKHNFYGSIGDNCIEVMDNVFIDSRTRILYNTRIGSNVIIGSGSLVNKDIPDNSVYAGVRARYICSFEEYVVKAQKYSENYELMFKTNKINDVADKLVEICINFLKVIRLTSRKDRIYESFSSGRWYSTN